MPDWERLLLQDHPARFPEGLARDHVISWSNPDDLVFDPFLGSGTTLKMAQQLGRRGIGIELSEDYCKIAVERLRQPSFFSIPDKPQPAQAEQMALIADLSTASPDLSTGKGDLSTGSENSSEIGGN